MSLKHSYTLIAPFYDLAIAAATRTIRQRSLVPLRDAPPMRVLVNGVGTGLDLPHVPPQHRYVGVDLTEAMLRRSIRRADGVVFDAVRADAQRLPFADASFDAAVLHLILAVVPEPRLCLAETARVLRPGGELLLLDKFLKPGERAPLRRMLNAFSRRLATRLDVVFEDVLGAVGGLDLIADEPALAGGWFRLIRLRRRDQLR